MSIFLKNRRLRSRIYRGKGRKHHERQSIDNKERGGRVYFSYGLLLGHTMNGPEPIHKRGAIEADHLSSGKYALDNFKRKLVISTAIQGTKTILFAI